MLSNKKDEAISSVVGEMLILALVLIVVALLATSAFNMLPGARDKTADIAMQYDSSNQTINFWHKGGDWIEKSELSAVISNDSKRIPLDEKYLTDWENNTKSVFDLGGCYAVKIPDDVYGGSSYEIRLTTLSSVIYAGRVNL